MKRHLIRVLGLVLGMACWLAITPARAEDKFVFLSEKLKDSSSFKVRLKAAVLLGRSSDERAVAPLVGALRDDNYIVRGAAARALGNLGHPMAAEAVDPIFELVGDEESFVRKEASTALERLAGERSLPSFIAALKSDSPQVRLTAVHVLAMVNAPEARTALAPVLGDGDEEVRAEVIVALKGLGQADIENILGQALGFRENYQAQLTAIRLVGELKLVSLLGKLADLLVQDDVVPTVQREAAEVLGLMKDHMNVPSLIAEIDSGDQRTRDRVIRCLGIHGGREAVDALMGLLRNPDPFVRRRAVYALGDAKDPRSIGALEFLLNSEEDARFKEDIKRTLRKIKPR